MEKTLKSPETVAWFREFVSICPEIQFRPMFGHLAGFVNGQMACGTFGERVILRPGDADRQEFSEQDGVRASEPLAART